MRNLPSRWRAAVRSFRTSSQARTRSRTASWSDVGTVMAVSSPARYSRASLLASRRAVLTRAPALTGMSAGAMTPQAIPMSVSCRNRWKPNGPAP